MGKRILFIALLMLVMGTSLSVSSSQQKAPVLSDITIEPPDPSLPDEVKALSGKWAGAWNSKMGWDCLLYVEKIDKDTAQVVHSFGEYTTSKGNCHCEPDWRRIEKAKVSTTDGTATLEFVVAPYRPLEGLHPSHAVSGSVDGMPRVMRKGSTGRYTFSFTLDKSEPDTLKGHFISSQASHLRTEMKKID